MLAIFVPDIIEHQNWYLEQQIISIILMSGQ